MNRLAYVVGLFTSITLYGAGPLDFGMKEVERALDERGINRRQFRFITQITSIPLESYRIAPGIVSGGDLRGLMYGLLEAAEQIRARGYFVQSRGDAAIPIRGVRRYLHRGDLDSESFHSREPWERYFAMFARNRLNRFNLVFESERLYPYFVEVEQFPEIRVPGLSDSERERNLQMLQWMTRSAAEHGVDFALGVREHGASPQYGYLALKRLLAECPSIRSVQLEAAEEPVIRAIREAGRLVMVELPAGDGAYSVRFPDRVDESSQESFYQELPGLPANWRFPAADPGLVRRTLAATSQGFEINAPSNSPEEFERHWLFYLLWGRLSYNPKTPDRLWTAELKRRYGDSAEEVLRLHRHSAEVLAEISAVPDSHVASIEESVRNRVEGIVSAKRTTIERASRLHALARELARAVEPDFRELATVATFHARRLMAADQLEYWVQTGDDGGLYAAARELRAARNLQPEHEEIDAEARRVARWIGLYEALGGFRFAFDFGREPEHAAPRLRGVTPQLRYSEERGYGWADAHDRATVSTNGEFWLASAIRGQGPDTFRVRTGDSEFEVALISPDGAVAEQKAKPVNGVIDVIFPEREWTVSAVIVKGGKPERTVPRLYWPRRLPRPAISHTPPAKAQAGQDLALTVRVPATARATAVRLHYRVDGFKTLEAPASAATFVIPGDELASGRELAYFFEILHDRNGGWFEPDSEAIAAFHTIRIE
ncbi:MAG: hypothetical protein ACK5AZ_21870 [Bryobacteraceae bacterium]